MTGENDELTSSATHTNAPASVEELHLPFDAWFSDVLDQLAADKQWHRWLKAKQRSGVLEHGVTAEVMQRRADWLTSTQAEWLRRTGLKAQMTTSVAPPDLEPKSAAS